MKQERDRREAHSQLNNSSGDEADTIRGRERVREPHNELLCAVMWTYNNDQKKRFCTSHT